MEGSALYDDAPTYLLWGPYLLLFIPTILRGKSIK